jgi:hypothetical protein
MPDKAVGIIHPIFCRGEMNTWAVFLI